MGEAFPQPDPPQEVPRPFTRPIARRAPPKGQRRHQHVFQNGALGQKVVRLKNEADLPVPHRGQFLLVEGA